MKTRLLFLLTSVVLLGAVHAEWRTESYTLKPGWNAIYPSVDASYTSIDQLVVSRPEILEIWRWQPERVDNRLPDVNIPPTGLEWATWKRGFPEETNFFNLTANYGYLIRVDSAAGQFVLSIKGRAALPEVRWRTDSLHLAGFPVVEGATAPTFTNYLATTGFALGNGSILRYNGGNIVENVNPVAVVPSVNRIVRGQAYWIKVNQFSRYYGPLRVELGSGTRLDFGYQSSESKMILTNQTSQTLTVNLAAATSDQPPAMQTTIVGAVPLKVRVDAETEYAPFTSRTLTMAPGAVTAVSLVVDRTGMSSVSGDHYASLLRVTTTAGVSGQDVYVPVTADVADVAGLWIGEAQITKVGSILRRFERDTAGNTVFDENGAPKVIDDSTTPFSGGNLPGVKTSYPLRVLLHVDVQGKTTLLSHIFQGRLKNAPPSASLGLTTSEALLDPAMIRNAVRLSVSHLPLDTDVQLAGAFAPGATLTTTGGIITGYTRAENPFLHIYHPDHDNLNARFDQNSLLPPGRESFDIKRTMTFTMDAIAPVDAAPGWGSASISGVYSEVIEGPYKTPIRVEGSFVLTKVSDYGFVQRP